MNAPSRSRFRVDPGHPALAGHFPGHPIVPGVVVLDEVVAAARRLPGGERALIGIPQVKFLSPLQPGVEAEVALEPGEHGLRFEVTAGGAAIARGVLAFGVRA